MIIVYQLSSSWKFFLHENYGHMALRVSVGFPRTIYEKGLIAQTPNEGINKKSEIFGPMWQTKYALAVHIYKFVIGI